MTERLRSPARAESFVPGPVTLPAAEAALRVLSVSHRTATLADLEAIALAPEAAAALDRRLRLSGIEAVALSTCNRTELYWCSRASAHDGVAESEFWASARAGRRLAGDKLRRHRGEAAARHLLRVAAGLESLLVGEAEVLGQVRDAIDRAREQEAAGPLLDGLFRAAVRFGRQARSATGIGTGALSVASVAVRLIRRSHPDLARCTVLVLGTGAAGLKAARHLRAERVGRCVLMNRTWARAQASATELGVEAAPLADLPRWLVAADAVVVAAQATTPLITARGLRHALAAGRPTPLVVMDVSVPRAVEAAVRELPGVVLRDLEDLDEIVAENRARREGEIPRVEAMLEEDLGKFREWVRTAAPEPARAQARPRPEAVGQGEPRVGTTAELLARYDRPGPRYTSYPTAVEFHEGFTEADYRSRLAAANRLGHEPLSLYAHLPFCEARCLFCGCNVVITRHRDVAARYLEQMLLEVDLVARHLPDRRGVAQMHWGGGTPTYYSAADLERLFGAIADRFDFTPDAELGIEADPRVSTHEQVARLRRLGFKRLSMGVQDFTPEVQEAVRRVQSYELTRALVERARAEGFGSINLDLIFGLPYQTVAGFRRTLERVIGIRPDRLAVYSFAFVPWIKAHMRRLPPEALPAVGLKYELLGLAIDTLTGAGYRQIGMDHFALPGDELSRAADAGTLSRNFMGYTVQAGTDLVGLGISAIGDVAGALAQNVKKLSTYERRLREGRFPIERGYARSGDDAVRRHVIMELMCTFRVDTVQFERRFGHAFHRYFESELEMLREADSPAAHGLLRLTGDALEVTPRGRPFVRNVCMVFDRYLPARSEDPAPVFSRTV